MNNTSMNNQQNNQEQLTGQAWPHLSSLDKIQAAIPQRGQVYAGPCTYARQPGHPAPPPTEQDIREILHVLKAQRRRTNRNRATVLVVIGLAITAYALWRLL